MNKEFKVTDDGHLKISLSTIYSEEQKEIDDFRKDNKNAEDFFNKFFASMLGEPYGWFLVPENFKSIKGVPFISDTKFHDGMDNTAFHSSRIWAFPYPNVDPIDELLRHEYVIFLKQK